MKAVDVYRIAEGAGIEMMAEGDRLRLRAGRRPPAEVLEAVRQHKSDLITFLAAREKKSAGAFCASLAAECRPRDDLRTDGLSHNVEPSIAGQCGWCGQRETATSVVVPFGPQNHTWLHPDCWPAWHAIRLQRADEDLRNRQMIATKSDRPTATEEADE